MKAYDLGLHEHVLAVAPRKPVVAEQRRHPRRQLSVRCWLEDGNHTVYARIHDVSLGGLSIRIPTPFSLDSELSVALSIAGGNGSLVTPVRAVARVVWLRSAESGPRMGTRFVDFPDGVEALRRLISR